MKKDVLLLADVFEKFINTYLKFYALDPCHYFSCTGLSWDATLRMASAEFEKISDMTSTFSSNKNFHRIKTKRRNFLHC